MRIVSVSLLLIAVAAAQLENARIGTIDFFAIGDLNARQLREALTIHPGDRLIWPDTRDRVRDELTKVAGRSFTQFVPVCCDKAGQWMVYIGFGERSGRVAGFRPKPSFSDLRLAPNLPQLYDEFIAALPDALKHQAGTPDDYSRGYALSSYPRMRAIQLRMRDAALDSGDEILRVLGGSADDKQRIAAAHLAGYARQSTEQIAALIDAARDENETVRNNAIRALGVLAWTPEFARQIVAEPFIDMLNSPVWSDRNKGLMLLTSLTRERNPELLAQLKTETLPALTEMAQWQFSGHSAGPIRILGRIAGMAESELDVLVENGDAGPVLEKFADSPRN